MFWSAFVEHDIAATAELLLLMPAGAHDMMRVQFTRYFCSQFNAHEFSQQTSGDE